MTSTIRAIITESQYNMCDAPETTFAGVFNHGFIKRTDHAELRRIVSDGVDRFVIDVKIPVVKIDL